MWIHETPRRCARWKDWVFNARAFFVNVGTSAVKFRMHLSTAFSVANGTHLRPRLIRNFTLSVSTNIRRSPHEDGKVIPGKSDHGLTGDCTVRALDARAGSACS